MFFIIALGILVISFVIALVSLLREQRKVHRLNQQRPKPEVSLPVTEEEQKTVDEKVNVEKTPLAKHVAEKPAEHVLTEVSKDRVDEETVPFPWEVKVGNNTSSPSPASEVHQADDRFPNISDNNIPSVFQEQALPPKSTSGGLGPTVGLSGSVSLKDLKK
jgi:hypothetical protein